MRSVPFYKFVQIYVRYPFGAFSQMNKLNDFQMTSKREDNAITASSLDLLANVRALVMSESRAYKLCQIYFLRTEEPLIAIGLDG